MAILNNPRLEPTIFFYTDGVDDLASFYTKTLGFRVKRSEPKHSYWLDTGAVTLVLHQSEPQYMRAPFNPAEESSLIWFQINDSILRVYERIREEGIPTAGDVEYQLNRGRLVIRDVEGRRIGLMGRQD